MLYLSSASVCSRSVLYVVTSTGYGPLTLPRDGRVGKLGQGVNICFKIFTLDKEDQLRDSANWENFRYKFDLEMSRTPCLRRE
jgi:hypothetical protein